MRVRLPVGMLAVGGEGLARLGRLTWRFRYAAEDGNGDPGSRDSADRARGPTGPGRARAARRGRGDGRRPDGRLDRAVYALWHEHLLPLAVLHAGQGAAVLTSGHRDGRVVARVLRRLGYVTARGSSTRGGRAGLRELIRAGREGRPLAITPDGPRGPRRRCKPGIVRAAAAVDLPVVPVAAAASTGLRLSSWDRFLVPAPGSVVYVSYGEPMRVGPEGLADPEAWARRLGEALDREAARCERRAGAR